MKTRIYMFAIALSTAIITATASAQIWRPKHVGLPTGFSAKTVYGEGHMILTANNSVTIGNQMYYMTDTSGPHTASPSTLGMLANMESVVVKCHGFHFVAGIGGVFKSHDNGHTWNSTAFITGASYALYAYHDTLYASMGAGVGAPKMSVDTGLTWTDIGYTGTVATAFLKHNGVLYVGSTGGLHYTTDNGATWNLVTAPATFNGVTIVGLTVLNGSVYAACSNGVFKSSDNGVTWTNVLSQSMFSLTTVDTSLVGGTNIHGVYISDNNGNNWAQISTGLPMSGGLYQAVNYVSANDDYLIASAQGDSAIYVIDLATLGLQPATAVSGVKVVNAQTMNISLSPNPASDRLAIKVNNGTNDYTDLAIVDLLGHCVRTFTIYDNYAQLSLADIVPGIYTIYLKQGNNRFLQQLVVGK